MLHLLEDGAAAQEWLSTGEAQFPPPHACRCGHVMSSQQWTVGRSDVNHYRLRNQRDYAFCSSSSVSGWIQCTGDYGIQVINMVDLPLNLITSDLILFFLST